MEQQTTTLRDKLFRFFLLCIYLLHLHKRRKKGATDYTYTHILIQRCGGSMLRWLVESLFCVRCGGGRLLFPKGQPTIFSEPILTTFLKMHKQYNKKDRKPPNEKNYTRQTNNTHYLHINYHLMTKPHTHTHTSKISNTEVRKE